MTFAEWWPFSRPESDNRPWPGGREIAKRAFTAGRLEGLREAAEGEPNNAIRIFSQPVQKKVGGEGRLELVSFALTPYIGQEVDVVAIHKTAIRAKMEE